MTSKRKQQISRTKFTQLMTDPSIKRKRGKGGVKQNLVISRDANGRQFVDWTCNVCEHRNHHLWYGRDVYVCNHCEQPTELKGQITEPISNV